MAKKVAKEILLSEKMTASKCPPAAGRVIVPKPIISRSNETNRMYDAKPRATGIFLERDSFSVILRSSSRKTVVNVEIDGRKITKLSCSAITGII